MPDKSWKAFERRLAKRMGGKRLACTGEKDGVDVDAGPFVYQAKLRRGVPSYLSLTGYAGSWELASARAVSGWWSGRHHGQGTMTRWSCSGFETGKPYTATEEL